MGLFAELKRRNVFRVGIAYAIAAWLLMQLTDVLGQLLDLPSEVGRIVVLLLVIGFIPALIFAWAFELTPEGIKREKDVDRSQSLTPHTGRKLNGMIAAMLALALAYIAWDAFQDRNQGPASPVALETTATDPVSEAPTSVAEPAIAVLPFADLSPEGDQEYFSDGISEELLNLLVRVDGLKVASRTSSFAFKGSTQGLAEIAQALKVDHVLEGSVRKSQNRVRITAQLIDATTDRHLWSETYDRELDDIFAIQDEIANAIVDALREELGVLANAGEIEVRADTENLDAYQLYLAGRGLFTARGKDNLVEARRLLERAVELDPRFARAWEALSAVYAVSMSWEINDQDYNEMAVVAARKALEIDPTLSLPHAVMGVKVGLSDRNYIPGLEHLEKAIQNDPKNATAWHWRGNLLADLGYQGQAIESQERCLELDPAYANCTRHMAMEHWAMGDLPRALELLTVSAEYGYTGSEIVVAAILGSSGNRIGAALSLWHWAQASEGYPVKDLLDAIERPLDDHSQGLARYTEWLERRGNWHSNDLHAMALLGGFDRIYIDDDGTKAWIWGKGFEALRASDHFKRYIRFLGLDTYWRERGFPPQCRPVGDDDFECER